MPGSNSSDVAVAIVGMACRLPGARNYRRFWQNIVDGICSIRRYTRSELLAAGLPAALIDRPDYIPAHGFLDGYDSFDASFFGYLPREVEVTDPQHRVLLECSWEALEDAGYGRSSGLSVGVFAGVTINTYLVNNVLRQPGLLELLGDQQIMLGSDKDYAPLRVAHKLGLRGPAMGVQAACASSLVAVHVACRSLLAGECDMALAGGASVRAPQIAGYLYVPGGTNSSDGLCRAFDARASGSVAGSGAGMVVLKRLADAVSDGDHIHAVILGTSVNHDGGERASFIAPTVEGQTRAVQEALDFADVEPDSVAMVEAHGTGTHIGDPIEWTALSRGYPKRADSPVCALGSVKPNIGHLDAAAGIAGLIKTALALKHRRIPPSLFFDRPNPAIENETGRFKVATKPLDVPKAAMTFRAAVNGIGMGGVNSHAVLEEPPAARSVQRKTTWQVLPLSAKSPDATRSLGEELAERLAASGESDGPQLDLGAVALTLQQGRRPFEHRIAVTTNAITSAAEALRARLARPPRATREEAGRLAFLFPGQGVHALGMGLDLSREIPLVRERLEACCETARDTTGVDVAALLASTDAKVLHESRNAQLAIFSVSWALARALVDVGVQPDVMAGHSLGEITAATIAGVFTLSDALELVAERGAAMEQAPLGAMLAVAGPTDVVDLAGRAVWFAAVNGPAECTLAGSEAEIAAVESELRSRGIPVRRLDVSRAFHTPDMESAAAHVETLLRTKTLKTPQVTLISSVGEVPDNAFASPDYWSQQILRPVRFDRVVERLAMLSPACMIEVGPRRVLTDLLRADRRIEGERVVPALEFPGSPRESESFARALAAAWESGAEVNWPAIGATAGAGRVPLPTYPFERRRYWLEPPPVQTSALSHISKPPQQPAPKTPPLEVDATMNLGERLNATITVFADRIIITTGDVVHTADDAARMPGAANAEQRLPNTAPAPAPEEAVAAERPQVAKTSGALHEFSALQIAKELMGLETIDVRDDLMELGANSLMLARMVSEIRAQSGADICIADVLQSPSLAHIDALVAQKRRGEPAGGSNGASCSNGSTGDAVLSSGDFNKLLEDVERLSAEDVREAVRTNTNGT